MAKYNQRGMLPSGPQVQQLGLRPTPSDASSAEEASLNFSDLWDAVRRGKWIILLTTVLITAAILTYTLLLPATYEAATIVSVDYQPANSASITTPEQVAYIEPRMLSQEVGVLEYSVVLAARVAEDIRQRSLAEGAGQETYPILYGEQDSLRSNEEVTAALFKQVSFRPLTEQNMIEIVASSAVPKEAAAIANFYADEYQVYSREQARSGITATREFLEEQVVKWQKKLRELEQQWASFAQQNEMTTYGEGGRMLVNQYAELSMKRETLGFQASRQQAVLDNLQQRLQEIRPDLRQEIAQEQAAASVQRDIEGLDAQIAQLRTQARQYYVNDPGLRGNEERIPELAELTRRIEGFEEQRAQLMEEYIAKTVDDENEVAAGGDVSIVDQLQSRIMEQRLAINETQTELEGVEQALGAYGGRLQGIPQQVIEREQIERKKSLYGEFYTMLMGELQRTLIAQESKLGYVELVQQANAPNFPVSPDLKQNLVLGLLLGLSFGVGLAFILQSANRRLHRPEDVQESGYSLVGVIPHMDREVKAAFNGDDTVEVEGRQLSTRLLPLLNPWSPISENYRLVRTNLQFSNNGHDAPQVMLVTSPEMADGKTLTSINLAITLAQGGRRVLLMDADLRRPAAYALLGLAGGPGLAEVLYHSDDALADHVQATAVDGLHFLAAGHTEEPPPEVFGSPRMEALLKEARHHYDAIVIDSPPVLAVSDPILLAKQCDATLVVVSAERTDQRALEVARKTLEAVGVPIAGVIFNRFEAEHERGYGYGYRYGYEYGGYAREQA